MCHDARVSVHEYVDHLTGFHRVTKVDFLKHVYRLTKKEVELALDQSKLFSDGGGKGKQGDSTSSSSSSLREEFARLSKALPVDGSSLAKPSCSSSSSSTIVVDDAVFNTPSMAHTIKIPSFLSETRFPL